MQICFFTLPSAKLRYVRISIIQIKMCFYTFTRRFAFEKNLLICTFITVSALLQRFSHLTKRKIQLHNISTNQYTNGLCDQAYILLHD